MMLKIVMGDIEIGKICEVQCYTTWQAKAIGIKRLLILDLVSSVLYPRTLTAMGFLLSKEQLGALHQDSV